MRADKNTGRRQHWNTQIRPLTLVHQALCITPFRRMKWEAVVLCEQAVDSMPVSG